MFNLANTVFVLFIWKVKRTCFGVQIIMEERQKFKALQTFKHAILFFKVIWLEISLVVYKK